MEVKEIARKTGYNNIIYVSFAVSFIEIYNLADVLNLSFPIDTQHLPVSRTTIGLAPPPF